MALIKCISCGAGRETSRPQQTKYCRQCAVLKEMLYWTEERRRACANCGVIVVPRHRGEQRCGHCDHAPQIETCELCGCPGEQWLPGLMVCKACSSAVDKRADLVQLLSRLKRERKAARPEALTGQVDDRRQAQIAEALAKKKARDEARAAARGS